MATQEKMVPKQDMPTMWKPWPDFDQFRKEMVESMNQMFARGFWGAPIDQWMPEAIKFQPTFNMHQDKNNLVVEAGVPGIDKKDIKLNVTRDTLTLSGDFKKEEKTEKDKMFRTETHYGSFHRAVRLPVEVDPRKVQAELKDGVLRVTMPMIHPEHHEQVKIDVR